MALDGTVVANLAYELNRKLSGSRISKITQPETDELILTAKGSEGQLRLLLSSNASLPLAYLTDKNKPAPMTAPKFCMLLRKHIGGGRFLSVSQPGLERVLIFSIEHLDEMGDRSTKRLILELMGKHSNLIFTDENGMILDSIKHISAQVSSVREVLPGREYFIPTQEGKTNPLTETKEGFLMTVRSQPRSAAKAVYGSYTGISPLIANELCYRAGIDGDAPCASVTEENWQLLSRCFLSFMDRIRDHDFEPHIYRAGGDPVEFSSVPLLSYENCDDEPMETVSAMLENFYAEKSVYSRLRQKSVDLRHIVNTHLERSRRKYDLQKKQLYDTEKRDKYRLYGELIHTYGYDIPEGAKSFEAPDYETGEAVTVPLDSTLSPMENAKKYFDRYRKLKRTFEALNSLIDETRAEIAYLETVATALDIARSESDLAQIREELTENGYIRDRQGKSKKRPAKSNPYHYRSSDGYDIYVGKNNVQNDELTFKLGEGNDWWFHAKQMPGSHVLAKTKDGEMPDKTFEEAAALAAYYSRGRDSDKVEVDYIQKKHVKKPSGSKPGFVVYYTNYSMVASPDISGIRLISD
ncbi:MAG: NFACT family protein [Lachnospiraceae bacterium]|nr:NFACT family protein [Lachnospiraceae bacterium]